MIKPSELLIVADDATYKHYVFYGPKQLPNETIVKRLDKNIYGELNLSKIEWDNFQMRNGCYNYSKALASVVWNNANVIAKILDKYCKVANFQNDDKTLYICLDLK